jgi:hypothetical protein
MRRSWYVYSIGAMLFFLGLPTKAFLLRQSVSVVRGRSQSQSRPTCLATAHSPPDGLTKEELASRFVDVQEHYRQTQDMSQDDLCLSMLRTRLPDLHLNRCFVAPSTVVQAGMGLFASRDITETEMITLYPGDALIQWNGKSGVGDFSSDVSVMFGNHIQGDSRDARRVTSDAARGYEVKVRDTHSIVADPNLTHDAAYLGHMANDACALLGRSNACRTAYSQETANRHNAELYLIEGCHYAAIASKNVTKGEEIFVSYGENYWLSRL